MNFLIFLTLYGTGVNVTEQKKGHISLPVGSELKRRGKQEL